MVENLTLPPDIRLSIGELIEHRSELDCIDRIVELLIASGGWAHIFANFNVGGRQVDLAVFTEHKAALLEVKGYVHPVAGGDNGQWEQFGPGGARKVRNAYAQAWEAKLRLRDSIRGIKPVENHLDALVVVVPVIPLGSDVPSDLKVTSIGLNGLENALLHPSALRLNASEVARLAVKLGLEPVASLSAATDPVCLELERTFSTFEESFHTFYGPVAETLIADTYQYEGKTLRLDEVKASVSEGRCNLAIQGPSGCGKSLLAASCAVSFLQSGGIPLFVAGRNFEGDFRALLEKECALLGVPSASALIKAARLLKKKIAIFLDGYNECSPKLRASLTRSLQAFSLRHNASIIVSSQHGLERDSLLAASALLVSRPSKALKEKLAGIEPQTADMLGLKSLLDTAASGLEASLIGQVKVHLRSAVSSFALYDTYARVRLGASASEVVKLLSTLANVLVTRACFSLSVREFDRLFDSQNLTASAREHLIASGLLDMRGDRVSFVHELFFAAFAAEAVVRGTGGNVAEILEALVSPRLTASTRFIIGALEDESVLGAVLNEVEDPAIVYACYVGECGPAAKALTTQKLHDALGAMVKQARDIDFAIIGEGWHAVEQIDTNPNQVLQAFNALAPAIGDSLMRGEHIETVLAACRQVDVSIARFTTAHVSEAKLKNIPLKSATFSAAYVMNRDAAISYLVNFVHSGGLSFRNKEGPHFHEAIGKAWNDASTPGEFYLLIGLTKHTEQCLQAAPHIVRLLENLRAHPYHLQLDLIDFAGYLYGADEFHRLQIIDSLHAALDTLGVGMNGIIFEALSRIGGLDEEAERHLTTIREEIESALSDDNAQSNMEAWGVYSRQFDHPFDTAYWDEVQSLDATTKKRLLTKACRGAEAPFVWFLSGLIRELAKFNDPCITTDIVRWTALPDKESVFPQEAVDVFFSAYEALGCLAADLPAIEAGDEEADDAMISCGRLLYWANRLPTEDCESSPNTLAARLSLLSCSHSAAGALSLTVSWMSSANGTRVSLMKTYPNLAADVCRKALANREEQLRYFPDRFASDNDSISRFAINVLVTCGIQTDTMLLRSFCDDKALGPVSISAIKTIEERFR